MTDGLEKVLTWMQLLIYVSSLLVFTYNIVKDRKNKVIQEEKNRAQMERFKESIDNLKQVLEQKNIADVDRDARIAATDIKLQLLLQQHTENHNRTIKGEAVK